LPDNRIFTNQFFFSYFSGAALRNLEAADAGMKNDPDAADIDCTDPALQATINPPETLPIIKQVGMWQRQSPATSAPAAAPAATLAPLELRELPSYARFAFLSGLRPDLPVDNLAVSASKAPIFSSTNKIIGSLEKNELVQVIDRARGDRLWIRTASGQEGFTPQRQIVSGRSALTFAVEFAGPGANPDTTPIPIEPLLKTSLLSDLVVEFTERDGTLGLTRAQQLAHRVVTLAQQTLGDKQLLVPSIVAVPIDASPEKVPAGTIRVIMVVFALEPDIRIQLPQSSGIGKISIDSAIDLSGVIEANKNRPGAPAPEISTDALKATPFVAKRDRCFTAAAAAGPPPEGVATTVNFQIPRADKEPAAERARQALQAAGYATPSIVIAGDQKSLPQTEIRYCRLPANQTAAERAKKILGECDLGEMAIKDAPCSISNTIEIRLGG
jgi:hypothetical protein